MVAAVASPPARALALHPPLAERRRAVVDLFGTDALQATADFRAVLASEVARLFDDVVLPVVRPAWPAVDDAAFLAKWRGGFDLYCSLALSAIVCSARRPRTVSALSSVFRGLRLDEAQIARLGAATMGLMFRSATRAACRRAALVSAWILVLDEALDDGMPTVPLAERPAALARAMRGDVDDDADDTVNAVAALGVAIDRGATDDEDRAWLRRVTDDVVAWARGEVMNLAGIPDEQGLAHRTIGITASMDLLGWAIGRCAGKTEHEFLYRVAELGQMVDDYLDIDKDLGQGRPTPATLGVWTLETMRACYGAAEALLDVLADAAGEPAGAYRRLVHQTFRGQMQRMVQTLVDNP
jgi:hypothetical protein